MNELTNAALPAIRARGIATPPYERANLEIGVVHFGPGAFHRVHQAWYFDQALASDPRWGICEVALQSSGVRDALAPQQGLYTLAILDEIKRCTIVGAVAELLVARESPSAVVERLSSPRTSLITATVTEKGYCLRGDGSLDMTHPDIAHDLANPDAPRTLIGYLAAGLRQRRALGVDAPTIISCDNLVDNGKRLRGAVIQFAERIDAELARWTASEVAFPSSMVDSITPATDDALRALVAEQTGVADRWPVQREFFAQWVIEDQLRGALPDWRAIGVEVTQDVRSFERAKLRLLNGAHSTLAYVGSLAGYDTVEAAMHDTSLATFVATLMEQDIRPTLGTSTDVELSNYIASILRRFRNPSIRHLLAQIAWDGSQKLPFRLLGTIGDRLAAGADVARLAVPLAAWMHFIRRKSLRGERATDPLADALFAIGAHTSGTQHDVAAFLALEHMFPRTLSANDHFVHTLEHAYVQLSSVSDSNTLQQALQRLDA